MEEEYRHIELIEEYLARITSYEEFSCMMQLYFPLLEPEEELSNYRLALDLIQLGELRKALKSIQQPE